MPTRARDIATQFAVVSVILSVITPRRFKTALMAASICYLCAYAYSHPTQHTTLLNYHVLTHLLCTYFLSLTVGVGEAACYRAASNGRSFAGIAARYLRLQRVLIDSAIINFIVSSVFAHVVARASSDHSGDGFRDGRALFDHHLRHHFDTIDPTNGLFAALNVLLVYSWAAIIHSAAFAVAACEWALFVLYACYVFAYLLYLSVLVLVGFSVLKIVTLGRRFHRLRKRVLLKPELDYPAPPALGAFESDPGSMAGIDQLQETILCQLTLGAHVVGCPRRYANHTRHRHCGLLRDEDMLKVSGAHCMQDETECNGRVITSFVSCLHFTFGVERLVKIFQRPGYLLAYDTSSSTVATDVPMVHDGQYTTVGTSTSAFTVENFGAHDRLHLKSPDGSLSFRKIWTAFGVCLYLVVPENNFGLNRADDGVTLTNSVAYSFDSHVIFRYSDHSIKCPIAVVRNVQTRTQDLYGTDRYDNACRVFAQSGLLQDQVSLECLPDVIELVEHYHTRARFTAYSLIRRLSPVSTITLAISAFFRRTVRPRAWEFKPRYVPVYTATRWSPSLLSGSPDDRRGDPDQPFSAVRPGVGTTSDEHHSRSTGADDGKCCGVSGTESVETGTKDEPDPVGPGLLKAPPNEDTSVGRDALPSPPSGDDVDGRSDPSTGETRLGGEAGDPPGDPGQGCSGVAPSPPPPDFGQIFASDAPGFTYTYDDRPYLRCYSDSISVKILAGKGDKVRKKFLVECIEYRDRHPRQTPDGYLQDFIDRCKRRSFEVRPDPVCPDLR
jgi:hypothetical protein